MMYRNHTGGLALLEPHHSKHVSAMTTEALHSKADIAAELAARDARIAELEADAEAVERAVKYFTGEDVGILLEKMRAEDALYAAGKR